MNRPTATVARYVRVAALFFGAILFGGAILVGDERAQAEPDATYELYFTLEAEVRSRRFDADLRASAQLGMHSERRMDGGIDLTLEQPIAPATKFYWVDPAGPFGEESKLAAVVTLAEGSWDALEAARNEVARLGARTHTEWQTSTANGKPFDGAFAFIVVGPPNQRFALSVDAHGQLESTTNRLTDRWLNGPIDHFFESWSTTPGGPHGYWFWNHGESEPFVYEPHVYHALETALELFGYPMPEEGETAEPPRLAHTLRQIVATLAPKAESELSRQLMSAQMRRMPSDGKYVEVEITAPGLVASRVQVWEQELLQADAYDIDWREDGLRLSIKLGYRPLAD